ncbi:hypothetical protein [Actinokineospora fastidiosa]|uniref:Asp23/Gls24 family envelope stress response protein n=1 Tax=Actinokineospora fastidiosa TaxID=1816 RepID=A0A918GNE2_9PSEU|nr:hypothetical protein [Actinokineospora fastidiosa]GGS50245.1 hypothetical protein GCM10010171_51760 [Actinokineospora fastidiosa]
MTAMPCGRRSEDLLRLAADGPAADPDLARHARACPHCGPELARLDNHWDDVRAAAATPPPAPPGLAERMVDVLRGVRGTGGTYHGVAEGVRVADHVVVMVVRRVAADAVAGLGHVRAVRTEADTIHIGLAVRYGVAADALAERVRASVLAGLAERVGPVATGVDVRVVDVVPPPIG